MKRIFAVLFSFSILVCTTACLQTTFLTGKSFLTSDKMLPPPPTPEDPAFEHDRLRYEQGKTIRETERGKQAVKDAGYTLEYLAGIYSEPFGMAVSKENTPEIYALLERVYETSRVSSRKAKERFMRTRPYVHFNEPTPVPKDEKILRKNSSYPSGHTAKGWAIALVLAEINPARQNEILKRGFEYGESRVIVGFHYQSDVDAARIVSSALISRLQTNDEFVRQLQKAKEEFANKK